MKNKKILVILMVLTFIAVTTLAGCSSDKAPGSDQKPGGDAAKTYTIKVGLTTADTHSCNRSFAKFKELVEQKSNGSIKVEIYPNAQLGNDRESIEGVQMGSITMTNISSSVVAQFVPSLAIFDLPFLFPDKDIAYRLFQDPEITQILFAEMEQKGFKGLGFWEAGYRHLTTSDKVVKTPDDLKGLKIRTMSSPIQIATWEALGANPTPIAFSELYTALQQKTVVGQENPYGLIVSQKFYEVQKNLSTTGHILTVAPFIMNLEFYNSLPDDLKKVIDDAAEETNKYNYQIAEEEEKASKQELIDNGMQIIELTMEQKQLFKDKVASVYELLQGQVDATLFDKVVNFK